MRTLKFAIFLWGVFSFTAQAQTSWQNNGSNIYYSAGKVGIGTNNPVANLHVYGADNPYFAVQGPLTQLQIGVATCNGCYAPFAQTGDIVYRPIGPKHGLIFLLSDISNDGLSYIKFGDCANNDWIAIFNNRTMRIDGQLFAKEIKIQTNVWSDQVFRSDYRLPSITEVEAFIKKNNRLPDIPSEQEVKEKGIDLGDMQAKLLQKVEELTLYTIQQQAMINKLNARIEQLEKK